jgi:urea transporter
MFGLFAVLVTNTIAYWFGFDKFKIQQGYYGFNSLLVGLGLGIYFHPGLLLILIVLLAGVLTLFFSVTMEGVIGKYALPYLSIPFIFSLWALTLASREFMELGLNERGIYTLNDLYIIGGGPLVKVYEWWNNIPISSFIRSYFLSLGAILFQFNVLTGILICIGLLAYSRIAFTLSIVGYATAYLFYMLIGAKFSEVHYSYIGFNYILSAIALGGFFIVPNRSSYLWVILVVPLVAIVTLSLSSILAIYYLPVFSLPFNMVALVFLYVLKFRIHNKADLNRVYIQQNSPEKNLYAFINFKERFGKDAPIAVNLPFHGEWTITQGHNGALTHKDSWRHAWDFEIKDDEGKTYKNSGDLTDDYYCYKKNIIAPADGIIEEIVDNIPDNIIGERNLEYNWGNTIIIKHSDYLYSKLSHLKAGSFNVKEGDKVKRADLLAKCGNSGNSPFPHLHFQIQATPHIGSRTIDYPISNYILKQDDNQSIITVSVPQKDDVISNIQVNSALRKAFHFIPGEKFRFRITDNQFHEFEVEWEVKLDYFLNKYIECDRSKSKAYFKVDDAMLYFTHFEGDKKSILYYFYLASFRVCFGFYNGLSINDLYPLNMIFSKPKLFLQDFIAPFYRYKKAAYTLTYIGSDDPLASSQIKLVATTVALVLTREKQRVTTSLSVDGSGLEGFEVLTNGRKVNAVKI